MVDCLAYPINTLRCYIDTLTQATAIRIRLLIVAVLALCAVDGMLSLVHPSVTHAQTREEVILWTSMKDSKDIAEYRGYLDKYPNGTFASVAKRKIDELMQARGGEALAGSTWDFRLDWIVHHSFGNWAHMMPVPATSTDKNHKFYKGQFSFAQDGSCTYTDKDNAPCHWIKQGRIVTITEDEQKDVCGRVWTLTMTGDSMTGLANMFGRKGDICANSEQVSMTGR